MKSVEPVVNNDFKPFVLLLTLTFWLYIFRSIFGENALANLSIEKPVDDPESKVTGHIRIRAKSQVIYFTFK